MTRFGDNQFVMDMMQQINATMKSELAPLVAKIGSLEEKVNELNKDRVTRSDLEKLSSNFVPRDSYEARHSQLVDRDKMLEDDLRSYRNESTTSIASVQAKMEKIAESFDEKLKNQQQVQLSSNDRNWLRISQIMGALGLLGAALEFILQHVHFN